MLLLFLAVSLLNGNWSPEVAGLLPLSRIDDIVLDFLRLALTHRTKSHNAEMRTS
jgi:hypothetical protein